MCVCVCVCTHIANNYLIMEIHSEKCVIRQCCCENITEYTYTKLDGTAYYCNCMCYNLTWLAA